MERKPGQGHEAPHDSDQAGKRIGALVAIMGAFLVVVTIQSHRAHTHAVIAHTEVNDQWAFFQAKRLRSHTLDLGRDLLTVLPQTEKTATLTERYSKEIERYVAETKEIQAEARKKQTEADLLERKTLRFDLGEGFLELGLVLSSLYFLSKKKLFPWIGGLAGAAGAVIAATGFLAY